jgi:hypothetical protein
MDWLVAPFDHVFPITLDDVKITESPKQNVVGPLLLIVGVDGIGFTVTTVGVELAVHTPLETVTEYEPL